MSGRLATGILGLVTGLFLSFPGAAHAAEAGLSGPATAAWQPPERPPAPPPGEEGAPPAGEDPPTEEPGPEQTPVEGLPTDETPGEEGAQPESDAPGGEGEESGSDGEEPGEEGEDPETPGPELTTAPVGILPGRRVAAPAPVPGGQVIGMVLEDEGFLVQMAGGEVIAYERDGEATRWGLPGAEARFVGEDGGTVVVLSSGGEVTLRRGRDGARVGGFTTGRPPDHGRPPGPGAATAFRDGSVEEGKRGPGAAPATLAAGVLYWVSAGSLYGYRLSDGNPILEVALPAGQPSRVVAVPANTTESGESLPAFIVVSLGRGGIAAVSSAAGTTAGAVLWQAEGAGPVTGPALALPDAGLVIFGDEGGDLTAVSLQTGQERWRWSLAEGFRHPPLLSRGRLYAATLANSLYCFDARRGGERWRAALPGRPAAPPLRIAGAIVVVTQDGLLVELNAETGMRIGRPRDLDAEVWGVVRRRGDAAREDGWRDRRLFLGLRDGRLMVLGPR